MADIVYEYLGGLYLNITNECPCKCVFCIRDKMDTLGTAHEMWHSSAPDFDQIKDEFDTFPKKDFKEVVFCGYGEPTCEFENLVKTAKYIKDNYGFKIRVNTNGLGNLINKRDITPELCEVADIISISLNAPNAKRYLQITRNDFGIDSFENMLDFTRKCVSLNANVRMTVVDVITPQEVNECERLAKEIGVTFVAREYTQSSETENKIDVEKIAELANLNMSKDKLEKMERDMKEIVSFANELNSVDTNGVEPTAHIVPMKNVFHEDEVLDFGYTRQELLQNAKTKTEEYIYVPKSFE